MAGFYNTGSSLRRARRAEEDTDPMSSVANISDAMLVFACGLLIAIVLAWNVDLAAVKEVEIDEAQQVEDIESLRDMLASDGSAYIERGTVYQDPYTGQLYMLEAGEEGTGAGAQAEAGDSSASGQQAGSSGDSGAASGSSQASGATGQ